MSRHRSFRPPRTLTQNRLHALLDMLKIVERAEPPPNIDGVIATILVLLPVTEDTDFAGIGIFAEIDDTDRSWTTTWVC